MPIPIVLGVAALGTAWLAAGGKPSLPDADNDTLDAQPPPEDATVTAPTPAANTPDWTPYLEELRGDMPLDFLQRWITRESAGNHCSVGSPAQLARDGYAREAGIGQLYFESRAQRTFGVTADDLRPSGACDGQRPIRELTDDEARAQVESLVMMAASYYQIAGQRLSAQGLDWSEEDRLALTKLQHALPVLGKSFLPAAAIAGQAGSWLDFRAFVLGLDADRVGAIDRGAPPYMPFARLFANAEYTAGVT